MQDAISGETRSSTRGRMKARGSTIYIEPIIGEGPIASGTGSVKKFDGSLRATGVATMRTFSALTQCSVALTRRLAPLCSPVRYRLRPLDLDSVENLADRSTCEDHCWLAWTASVRLSLHFLASASTPGTECMSHNKLRFRVGAI